MKDKIYVPPIKIQGIKTKLVPYIRESAAVTPDTVWVEPFMGSGAAGFNLALERAVFADLNPCLIDFYNQIKEGMITSCGVRMFLEQEGRKLAEYDAAYYYEVRDRFNRDRNPLDFLFLNRACFNGMIRFNKSNHFNVPYGHKPQRFSKAYITKIVNQVRHVEELLSRRDWIFLCQPFEQTLSHLPPRSFIYCDPPYIGRHVDYYDSWEEADEIRLCQFLQRSGMKFMVSTWDYNRYRQNEYIRSVWGFCHKRNIAHFYHVGAKEANRNAMTEALLTNYPMTGQNNFLPRENVQLSLDLGIVKNNL